MVTKAIGGAGQTYDIHQAATGEVLAHVAEDGREGVAASVALAVAARGQWRARGALERAELVRALAGAVRAHGEELAELDSRNGGFPIDAARLGPDKGANSLEFFAGLALRLQGSTIPASTDHLHYTVREPFGVAGIITAFNHPTLFATARIAAALVAGNCVVLKPAQQTPLSAIRIAELAQGILPVGVLTVVTGGGETGSALVSHPDVPRIGFTGSVETALTIQETAAKSGRIKRVSLQLGGKNPLIVMPDADLDRAVNGAIEGMNLAKVSGQSCGSTSRAFVHSSIHDEFVARVAARFEALRLRWPDETEPGMGPLVSAAQRDRAERYVRLGREEGARVVTGGQRPPAPFDRGYYVPATLLDGVHPNMRLAQEEVFGPVLAVISWTDEAAMVRAVNAVRYGLTAAIYTRDLAAAHRVANSVEAGYVWINTVERRWIGVPFGGFKDSGTSTEYSADELFAYSQIKSINVSLS